MAIMKHTTYAHGMQLWEMTDHELRVEAARAGMESNRYDEIMAELEERAAYRRSMGGPRRPGWHSATDLLTEGS